MLIGLTPDAIEGIISKLKQKKFEEPVASIEECDLAKLHSSLKTPFLRPDLNSKSQNFCEKAGLLFFLLTENHCFKNSNKRIAVAALVTLADVNGYKINISEVSLYALSMAVTMLAKYNLVDEAKYEITKMIEVSLTKLVNSPQSDHEKSQIEKEFIEYMNSTSF